MCVIVPLFLWSDIQRMVHYLRKTSSAKKVSKVRRLQTAQRPLLIVDRRSKLDGHGHRARAHYDWNGRYCSYDTTILDIDIFCKMYALYL